MARQTVWVVQELLQIKHSVKLRRERWSLSSSNCGRCACGIALSDVSKIRLLQGTWRAASAAATTKPLNSLGKGPERETYLKMSPLLQSVIARTCRQFPTRYDDGLVCARQFVDEIVLW